MGEGEWIIFEVLVVLLGIVSIVEHVATALGG